MIGRCELCHNKFEDIYYVDNEMNGSNLTWYQWQTVDQRSVKCKQDGQVQDAVAEVVKQLDYFKQHNFIKRKQANSFEEKTRAVNGHNIEVQVDFAENYMAIGQDEIQSAHWNHLQVTLFTVCTWIDSDTTESSVIVSDDMIHGKLAVSCFLGKFSRI